LGTASLVKMSPVRAESDRLLHAGTTYMSVLCPGAWDREPLPHTEIIVILTRRILSRAYVSATAQQSHLIQSTTQTHKSRLQTKVNHAGVGVDWNSVFR